MDHAQAQQSSRQDIKICQPEQGIDPIILNLSVNRTDYQQNYQYIRNCLAMLFPKRNRTHLPAMMYTTPKILLLIKFTMKTAEVKRDLLLSLNTFKI